MPGIAGIIGNRADASSLQDMCGILLLWQMVNLEYFFRNFIDEYASTSQTID